LTETFVFVLNYILSHERPAGVTLLNLLCVNGAEFEFKPDEQIEIRTQVATAEGTPDIMVVAPDKFILVKVKHDSGVGPDQVERYDSVVRQVSSTGKKHSHLVLLTRYQVDFEGKAVKPYKHVRWSDVYNWVVKLKLSDPVASHYVREFADFLKEKHMTVQQITWEYVNGVPALKNLLTMLNSAIDTAGVKINSKSSGWDFVGFWVRNNKNFVGVEYARPTYVVVQTRLKSKWPVVAELDLTAEHFFYLDKDEQLKVLTKFVKAAISLLVD